MTRLARVPLLAALLLACGEDLGPRVPAAIVVTPAAPLVAPNDTLRLTATVVDAAGDPIDGRSVTFRSSDETVLTADDAGLLTAVGYFIGSTARITATSGDITAEVEAAIGLPPSALLVSPRSLELDPGQQGSIEVTVTDENGQAVPNAIFTFQGGDARVVRVESLAPQSIGVTGLGLGTTTVTVTSGSLSRDVTVTVDQTPRYTLVTPTSLVLSPGGSQQATAALINRSGQEMDLLHPFTWSSSNEAVVTVSPAGMVSSVGPEGSAIITATADTFTARLPVFVGTPPAGEKLARVGVEAGAGLALTADGRYFVSSYGTFLGGQLPDFAFPIQVPTEGWANDIVLNPAGTRAYLIGMGPGVIVVDLATHAVVDSIPVHTGGGVRFNRVWSGVLSKDGSILTVGTYDGFEVIDVASKASLGGTAVGLVGKLTHHPSKPLLYASSDAGMFELDEKSGAIIRRFPGGGYEGNVVSPDGTTLYAVDFSGDGAAVWNLETGALERTLAGIKGTDVAISSDGRFLYVIRGGYDFVNRLRIYDVVSGAMVREVLLDGLTRRIALAADGTAIITNENSTGDPGWVDFVR